ncbi:MAG: hypothetical protein FWD82_06005 [Defluviitaleaceae bacterium]|nr:hypothetical protein [Defluviitaleaceae bacterium]
MSKVCMIESLCRHIGQTVTLFTASGGLSGDGFTGVLAHVGDDCIKLICSIGMAPSCCVGSSCLDRPRGERGCGRRFSGGNILGSVCVIPICKIVSFTHNSLA